MRRSLSTCFPERESHALEGTTVAVWEILEKGRGAEAYRAWIEGTHAQEASVRAEMCRRATDRIDGTPFWRRRAININAQLMTHAVAWNPVMLVCCVVSRLHRWIVTAR